MQPRASSSTPEANIARATVQAAPARNPCTVGESAAAQSTGTLFPPDFRLAREDTQQEIAAGVRFMGEQLKRLADVLEARHTNAPLAGQADPAEDDSIRSLQRTLQNARRRQTADNQRMVCTCKKHAPAYCL
jgi:hypothetical protein